MMMMMMMMMMIEEVRQTGGGGRMKIDWSRESHVDSKRQSGLHNITWTVQRHVFEHCSCLGP
jgi:hypothetical protein